MKAVLIAAGVLALAACAGSDPGGRRPDLSGHMEGPDHDHLGPPGFDRQGGPPRPMLFISPMGEPFRAPPGRPYPVALWFSQADANRDGVISKAEFVADALAFFDRLDIDHDGVIDGFELVRYERDVVPEIVGASADDIGDGRRHGRGGGPRRSDSGEGGAQRLGAAPYSLLNDAEPVSSADRTLTQRISRADFAAAAAARFGDLHGEDSVGLRLDALPKTSVQRAIIAREPRYRR